MFCLYLTSALVIEEFNTVPLAVTLASDPLFYGDGLAQWTMAATGVVALFFSVWAVWLVKRTLEATREAARSAADAVAVSREIGEAQVRAYLVCRSAKYEILKDDGFSVAVNLENTGQSPASNVLITGTLTVHEVGGFSHRSKVLQWADSEEEQTDGQPIAAQRETSESLHFWKFQTDDWKDEKRITEIIRSGNELWIDLVVSWSDVFNRCHELPVNLSAVIDRSPNAPNKRGRSRSGALDFRMSDARPGDSLTESPPPN